MRGLISVVVVLLAFGCVQQDGGGGGDSGKTGGRDTGRPILIDAAVMTDDVGMGGDDAGEDDTDAMAEDIDDGVERDGEAPQTACSNGLDDDGDGLVDDDDPGCTGPDDDDEFNAPPRAECDDALDNDEDGQVDLADSDCGSTADPTERGDNPVTQCSNGVDDDEDGAVDFPEDPGCRAAGDEDETDPVATPACANGEDDDGDGATDFPTDPGCAGRGDLDEEDPDPPPACSNGEDDDENGVTDYPDDPGCESAADPVEANPCGVAEVVDLTENPSHDGTTVGAPEQHVAACGGAAGGERVFTFRVDRVLERLIISTDHPETESPTVLYVRRQCGGVDIQCDRGAGETNGTTLTLPRPALGLYFIIVDQGARDGGGAFRLTVDAVDPPQCRDGIDNDEDGLVDAADCGCTETEDPDEADPDEAAVCCNGLDDDEDGTTDYPDDEDCEFAGGERETPLCDLDSPSIRVGPDGGEFELPILPGGPGSANATCEFVAAKEVVLVVDIIEPSNIFVEVVEGGAPFQATMHARTDCADVDTEIACHRSQDMGPLAVQGVPRGRYYIFVEQGPLPPEVPRVARVVIESNVRECNDEVDNDGDDLIDADDPGCTEALDNSEQDPMEPPECSDGIDNDMDMAIDYPDDPHCEAAGDESESPLCELVDDVVQLGQAGGRVMVNTAGRMNQYQGGCGGAGPEAIVALTLQRPSGVTWEIVEASYDTVIFLRSVCDDANTELDCDDDGAGFPLSLISLPRVEAGTTFLFVDGFGAGSGNATLQVTVRPL